jgi:hypothetical protein
MNASDFYSATIPVFLRALDRIDALASLGAEHGRLDVRLAPDIFAAGEQFGIAQGYILRIVFPLVGREIPTFANQNTTQDALISRAGEVRELLKSVTEADFEGAVERPITHTAGDATLTQSGLVFLTQYGLPNFYFHMSMGYASLRYARVAVGKGDFDGFHQYEKDFSFI